MRTQFSTELARAREAVTLAQEQAEASERRSLRELDAERTARQQSDRTAEALRGELVAARGEARDAAVAQAEVRARLEAQAAALADRLASAEQAQRKSAHDLDAVQAELGAAQRRAERAEAEAALALRCHNLRQLTCLTIGVKACNLCKLCGNAFESAYRATGLYPRKRKCAPSREAAADRQGARSSAQA